MPTGNTHAEQKGIKAAAAAAMPSIPKELIELKAALTGTDFMLRLAEGV